MIKGLIFVLLVTALAAYDKEGNVLVLHDSDFPQVLKQFDYILIEFYAPWCGHCKKLNPIYTEVADELEKQGSPVKLAKVDATVEKKAGSTYKVQGYPTIYFFHKGEKLDYKGQRTTQVMLNWLLKKTRDPLVPIDQAGYEKLQTEQKVSIVFHGDASSAQGQIVNKLAVADDFNTYYIAQVGKSEGSVELFRPFDSAVTYESADEGLEAWVRKNERPIVVPFDDRTIGDMFSSSKAGLCLFDKDGSSVLVDAFNQAAKAYIDSGKSLIFTHIDKNSQHLGPFADYIKTNPATQPLVLIDGKTKSKFVLIKNPSEVTSEDILQFLQSWGNGDQKKYQMTEQVKVQQQAQQAEQL